MPSLAEHGGNRQDSCLRRQPSEGRAKQARQQTDGQITDSGPVVKRAPSLGQEPSPDGMVRTRGPGICGGRKGDSPRWSSQGRSDELCIGLIRLITEHGDRAYRRLEAGHLSSGVLHLQGTEQWWRGTPEPGLAGAGLWPSGRWAFYAMMLLSTKASFPRALL